jgi:FSR family fosmidomycin resistance protein-like MFS transporter
MNRATLRLVLLLSCCHAMVHVYELSFGTVELKVAEEFGVGKEVTGVLASCLRLPFGLCALLAGWLADHFGAKRLLPIYLIGCSGAAVLAWYSPTLALLSVAMFSLGVFASIYHPAGVALISHQTTPQNRPMALGYHGIFGSAGIAAGPFLAGLVLISGMAWRQYYLLLSIPGILLAVLLFLRLSRAQEVARAADLQTTQAESEDGAHWVSYFTLIFVVSLAGIVYASMMTFMPRYLNSAGVDILGGLKQGLFRGALGEVELESIGVANFLTSAVLLLGVLGQFAAGRIAKPTTLEPLMACAFLGAAPCVLWIGFAHGTARIWAAALFAPVFFMHQPLFNSLVSKYTPRRRRSLCYGLSFTLGFGIGSVGPVLSGSIQSDRLNSAILTTLLTVAGGLTLLLWRWHGPVVGVGVAEEKLL